MSKSISISEVIYSIFNSFSAMERAENLSSCMGEVLERMSIYSWLTGGRENEEHLLSESGKMLFTDEALMEDADEEEAKGFYWRSTRQGKSHYKSAGAEMHVWMDEATDKISGDKEYAVDIHDESRESERKDGVKTWIKAGKALSHTDVEWSAKFVKFIFNRMDPDGRGYATTPIRFWGRYSCKTYFKRLKGMWNGAPDRWKKVSFKSYCRAERNPKMEVKEEWNRYPIQCISLTQSLLWLTGAGKSRGAQADPRFTRTDRESIQDFSRLSWDILKFYKAQFKEPRPEGEEAQKEWSKRRSRWADAQVKKEHVTKLFAKHLASSKPAEEIAPPIVEIETGKEVLIELEAARPTRPLEVISVTPKAKKKIVVSSPRSKAEARIRKVHALRLGASYEVIEYLNQFI